MDRCLSMIEVMEAYVMNMRRWKSRQRECMKIGFSISYFPESIFSLSVFAIFLPCTIRLERKD